MIRWYRRLADIAGVNYPGSPGVQRMRLPNHNIKPEIQRYDVGGRRHEAFFWRYCDGTSSSASPAKSWDDQSPAQDAAPETILHHLYEVLELPGEAADYNFALQSCWERLWNQRRAHPWLIGEAVLA